MSLYPPLSPRSRRQLWTFFLGKIDPDVGYKCSDEQIECLARKTLNGREVSDKLLTRSCSDADFKLDKKRCEDCGATGEEQ